MSPSAIDRIDLLLVMDDPLVRITTGDVLKGGGYRVIHAVDSTEALRLVAALPGIDLVVTDAGLRGGLSGYELARRLTSERPELTCLIVSGAERPADEALPVNTFFLAKPVHPADLLQALLGLREARQAMHEVGGKLKLDLADEV